MHDIWNSPAWWSLKPFTTTKDNFTFSFFIDWFNLFLNKIVGKIALCGTIMMFGLNLPYYLWHQPENTYFAGITPPSYESSIMTIIALLDPIVEQLQHFYHGQIVWTYWYQTGITKKVALLPAIGDLPAICKAFGFAGVMFYHFCSFYTLYKSDIGNLNSETWKPRNGREVIIAVAQ